MQQHPTQAELLSEIAALREASHMLAVRLEQHVVALAEATLGRPQFDLPTELRELFDANRSAQADLRRALSAMSAIASR